METEQLKKMATQVRRDILRMVNGVQSGHPGGSLGCADFVTALYFSVMQYNKKTFSMDGKNEDLFFLSNGHISPLLYAVLARVGFFEIKELGSFRKINSRLQGHPTTHTHLPGIRMSSGSLGQGMSVAIGAALSKKYNNETSLIYSLHGDGELEEGQNWEAMLFAAHNKVDNLICTVDCNGQQIDGTTNEVMNLGNLTMKFEAFGWTVVNMDGNDMDNIIQTMQHATTLTGKEKPICILMKTIMGKGVSFMEGTHHWHGTPPSDEQLQQALTQLPESLGDY